MLLSRGKFDSESKTLAPLAQDQTRFGDAGAEEKKPAGEPQAAGGRDDARVRVLKLPGAACAGARLRVGAAGEPSGTLNEVLKVQSVAHALQQ